MATSIDYFTLPGTQFVPVEAFILADSMGQNIGCKVIKADCEFFPGCKIYNLTRKLVKEEFRLSDYKCITLIIGTCDISSKLVWKTFLQTGVLPPHTPKPIDDIVIDYRNLLDVIRKQNSTAKIIICSILPRPFDHIGNRQYLKDLNYQLEILSKSISKCKYLNISRKFIHCGEIRDNYFEKDLIHLSPAGNRVLTDTLNTVVGQILKE